MMQKVLVLMDMPLYPYRIYAYNELVKRGYDLTVVSVSTELSSYNIPFSFKHIRLSPQKIGPFINLKAFNSIRYDDYDVIVVDPNLRMLDYYRFYRKKYWGKLVGWGHHKGRTTGNKFAEWLRFRFFRKFRSLVFYDLDTIKEYIAKGFDPERLFLANNTQFVDLSTVHLESERNSFLYVGRIQDRKRIDLAIEAFNKVVKEHPNLRLKFYIVGSGKSDYIEKLIIKFGLSGSVVLCGPVHDENKLAEYFNSAIAYISPGHVGLGVLHSLAFGVPVITCRQRKHSLEIINCNKNNSFIVDFNKDSIANAMIKLLDFKTFKSMSINAHNYYKDNCTIDKMVDGIDDGIRHLHKGVTGSGKLLSVCNNEKILYKNYLVYKQDNPNMSCVLPHNYLQKLMSYSRILTRLFRLEPRACINICKNRYLISMNNRILHVDIYNHKTKIINVNRRGFSTPLNFCKDEEFIYWGDYGRNPQKAEVLVYQMDRNYKVKVIYTFPAGQIRHIHNIVYDNQNERFWVFTGDNEPNSGIYLANKMWTSVMPFRIGLQKYRAVVGFPTMNGLIYATDSVETNNHIYYISKDGTENILSEINGSCIYGTSIKNKYILSTTVESHEGSGIKALLSKQLGSGIKSKEVHLVIIDKTNLGIKIVRKFEKDFWPMKLMQYGCLTFPCGQENNTDLWYNVIACKGLDGSNIYINSRKL